MNNSYKMGPEVLVEIIAAVQYGLLNDVDISQKLRDIEMEDAGDGSLQLTTKYLKKTGRDR